MILITGTVPKGLTSMFMTPPDPSPPEGKKRLFRKNLIGREEILLRNAESMDDQECNGGHNTYIQHRYR